ncbi:MAG: hypothetical protein IRY87_03945 [Acetobacteraceae bacterium]|nr:hypothetical protein [Acetobacteraceae bacterium]
MRRPGRPTAVLGPPGRSGPLRDVIIALAEQGRDGLGSNRWVVATACALDMTDAVLAVASLFRAETAAPRAAVLSR